MVPSPLVTLKQTLYVCMVVGAGEAGAGVVIGEDALISRDMDSGPVPAASPWGSLEHLHALSLVSE